MDSPSEVPGYQFTLGLRRHLGHKLFFIQARLVQDYCALLATEVVGGVILCIVFCKTIASEKILDEVKI